MIYGQEFLLNFKIERKISKRITPVQLVSEEGHNIIRLIIESVQKLSFNFLMSQDISYFRFTWKITSIHVLIVMQAMTKCLEIVDLFTLNIQNEWHDKFLALELQKEQATNFSNILNRPILVGDGIMPIW